MKMPTEQSSQSRLRDIYLIRFQLIVCVAEYINGAMLMEDGSMITPEGYSNI